MSELTPPDIAHLGPVELLTPKPAGEPRLLHRDDGHGGPAPGGPVGLPARLGRLPDLVAEADRGAAVRAWATAACAPGARRRSSAASALIEADRPRRGWDEQGDHGIGRAYSFSDPDGHRFKIYNEVERYVKPVETDFKNVHGKQPNKAIAVKRLDHLNILAGDVRANRDFCVDTLGYRQYERIELDDGTLGGSWMSVTIAAHELIYTKDAYAAQGAHGRLHHVGVLGRHARGVPARRRHLDRERGLRSSPRPPSTRRAGLLPLRLRARRQPRRGHHRRAPRLRARRAVRDLDRGRPRQGPGLGQRDRPHLPHLRHAAVRGRADAFSGGGHPRDSSQLTTGPNQVSGAAPRPASTSGAPTQAT